MSVIGAVNSGSEPGATARRRATPWPCRARLARRACRASECAGGADSFGPQQFRVQCAHSVCALVPLRSHADKDGMGKMPHYVEAFGMKGFSRPLQQEYDGLESGELAWIKRTPDGPIGGGAGGALGGMGSGSGFGVDRMQRLCYTGYIEALFSKMNRRRPSTWTASFSTTSRTVAIPRASTPTSLPRSCRAPRPSRCPTWPRSSRRGRSACQCRPTFRQLSRIFRAILKPTTSEATRCRKASTC